VPAGDYSVQAALRKGLNPTIYTHPANTAYSIKLNAIEAILE
jgi:hypothetical protein